jgi:hypothetical protein
MVQRQEQRSEMILRHALSTLLDIVLRKDYEPFALGLALFRIGWGLLLLMPWDTFSSVASFRLMDALFSLPQLALLGRVAVSSEAIWGTITILLSLIHLYGILLDRPAWRSWGSLFGIGNFIAVAVMVGIANPQGTGWWSYGCLALFALFCWLRFYLDWKLGVS